MKLNSLKIRQIINLAICAFGIQFATALQMANMSSLYKFLGAASSNLSYLWLAAPVSGLLVQPLVGQMSDSTQTRFGKRIPYIFSWGILTCLSIALMPFSTTVVMAAILLWALDCSINGCTETLRALTADITPNSQKATAFAAQTIFAGLGAGIAAMLPWTLENIFHLNVTITAAEIPLVMKFAFILGGIVLFACMMWTIRHVKEKPFVRSELLSKKKKSLAKTIIRKIQLFFSEIFYNLRHMPKVIRQFYLVQIFTWTGLFCMWLYFALAISQRYFNLPHGANVATSLHYTILLERGTEWSGVCYGIYQFVSVAYALVLPYLARRILPKAVHALSLVMGALGIISIGILPDYHYLVISMLGIGIMWGSIMTMPYAIISAELPRTKVGLYLGIFNVTITVPQIISSLSLSFITTKIFNSNAILTLMFGGLLILIGGVLMLGQQYGFNLFAILKGLRHLLHKPQPRQAHKILR